MGKEKQCPKCGSTTTRTEIMKDKSGNDYPGPITKYECRVCLWGVEEWGWYGLTSSWLTDSYLKTPTGGAIL